MDEVEDIWIGVNIKVDENCAFNRAAYAIVNETHPSEVLVRPLSGLDQCYDRAWYMAILTTLKTRSRKCRIFCGRNVDNIRLLKIFSSNDGVRSGVFGESTRRHRKTFENVSQFIDRHRNWRFQYE